MWYGIQYHQQTIDTIEERYAGLMKQMPVWAVRVGVLQPVSPLRPTMIWDPFDCRKPVALMMADKPIMWMARKPTTYIVNRVFGSHTRIRYYTDKRDHLMYVCAHLPGSQPVTVLRVSDRPYNLRCTVERYASKNSAGHVDHGVLAASIKLLQELDPKKHGGRVLYLYELSIETEEVRELKLSCIYMSSD